MGEHGRVDLVVNNAGVALLAEVPSMTVDDLQWLMGVDFFGVVYGTKAFLPHLLDSDDGHIVNISSVLGLLSAPSQSAYNAAKFAVRGFTDSLRMELEAARSGVSCTTVLPGGIRTDIVRHARVDPELAASAGGRQRLVDGFDILARTTPEAAARRILAAVERNQRRLLIGTDARFIDLVSRMAPGLYQRALVAGARLRRTRANLSTNLVPPVAEVGDSARTAPPMAEASSATMAKPSPEPTVGRCGRSPR